MQNQCYHFVTFIADSKEKNIYMRSLINNPKKHIRSHIKYEIAAIHLYIKL